ncbi:MAG: hydrogenase nickel incorporation protein HypB [Arenicellales bacterium]|nr:hydrogenase nickel incorporation protein HypB [Arenicellales bacterium]
MCDTCGCNVTSGNEHLLHSHGKLARTTEGSESIEVLRDLLHENDHQARHNREHFDQHDVLAINLMSSPGAGKTRLLEATIDRLAHDKQIGVVEGDLETERDAQRIRSKGVPAVQITTGSACHLDAHLVHEALHQLDLAAIDFLFIENVGNLVCPASFDLGQHLNVTLLSVTEGDDKPAKYPVMFRQTDLMLISKIDLLPHLTDFDPRQAELHLRQLANPAQTICLSAQTGEGLDAWCQWVGEHLAQSTQTRRLAKPVSA